MCKAVKVLLTHFHSNIVPSTNYKFNQIWEKVKKWNALTIEVEWSIEFESLFQNIEGGSSLIQSGSVDCFLERKKSIQTKFNLSEENFDNLSTGR